MRYRNVQKLLGLIMAVGLVLGPVFQFPAGAFMYEQEARELHDLGLLNGTETPIFNPDLAAAVDRETGVVMILRLLDLEEAALAMPAEQVETILSRFSDASEISSWARSSVAYAVANGLVAGLPNKTFGPHLPLTGNAYCTLILRQLGFQPDYQLGAVQLGQMGVLTVEQMEGLGPQELNKDYLVGISFEVLSLTQPGLLSPPSGQAVSISGPETVEAVAGESGKINFSLEPITRVAITYTVADRSVADILGIEQQDNGVCTLNFAAKNPGTTTLTLVGSRLGYAPAALTVKVTVKGKASINGLESAKRVGTGECSLPFQALVPEGARISAAGSNSSVLDDIAISGYGEERFLKFNAREPGQSTITVSIGDGGSVLASRQILVTVVDRPVINGFDGVIEVTTGNCSLPFSVEPAGAAVSYLDCNSSNLSDIRLDYNETSGSGRLNFWAGSPGPAVITLQASKVGYEVLTQYIQIEVQTPADNSGAPTPAITLGGLENVVVSGATLQYLPFTVNPADAVINVTAQNNSAFVSGASIISVLSSSDAPARLLCFELDGAGGTDAQITVAASMPGYTGTSQTITVNVTGDPVNHVNFDGISNYTKNSIVTGASYEVTLHPNSAVPSVYYKNAPGITVISSVSLTNNVLPARNLAFWVNYWGIAEIYLVGRSGNQLDSGKSIVTVTP